jgi:hypothetical protein
MAGTFVLAIGKALLIVRKLSFSRRRGHTCGGDHALRNLEATRLDSETP